MKLDEIINASVQSTPEQPVVHKADVNDEVEKLAESLEALAEEDTLLDDLAKVAVLADLLEARGGH